MINLIYDLIYGVPLCLIMVLAGAGMLGAPQQSILPTAVAFLTMGVCVSLKYWESRLRFLLPGVLLAIGAGVVLIHEPEKRMGFVLENKWVLWVALCAVLCFLIGRLIAEQRWVRRAFAALFLADLLYAMLSHAFPNKGATAAELLFLLVCVVEEIQQYWEKSGYTDRKGHLVSIAPFLLVIGITVFALPAPAEPFDWDFAVQIWRHTVEEIKITSRFFHRNSEDYALVGFSDEGNFWGSLQKKNRTVMEISGRADLGAVVYLPGRVMDGFDGRTWTASYTDEGRDRTLDMLETLCAVTQAEPEYLQNYLWRVDLLCKYDEFNTKYLFVPFKALIGREKIGSVAFRSRGMDLLGQENLGYRTEYSVSYFRLNRGHQEVGAFLENLEEIDPAVWKQVRDAYDSRQEGSSYEDLLAYREKVRQYYLPETKVSERASAYLEELFEGADGDLEKLERIEKMLNSLTYSNEPGKLPEKVDGPEAFLDYFLFDLQKGYCSHFATAFVLLARSQGIPARYVEGYYVKKGSAQSVNVTTGMAHSWPEVYLEGYGWLPFEPTPGYRQTTRWAFKKTWVSDKNVMPEEESRDQEEEDVPLPQETEQGRKAGRWFLIFLPLGFGFLFFAGFLAMDLWLSKRWYRGLGDAEKFTVTFWRNLRILSLLGWSMEEGETLAEFDARMAREMGERFAFLQDYEKVIYGGVTPDAEMVKRICKDYEKLLDELQKQTGKWFWWHYYRILSKKNVGSRG